MPWIGRTAVIQGTQIKKMKAKQERYNKKNSWSPSKLGKAAYVREL